MFRGVSFDVSTRYISVKDTNLSFTDEVFISTNTSESTRILQQFRTPQETKTIKQHEERKTMVHTRTLSHARKEKRKSSADRSRGEQR